MLSFVAGNVRENGHYGVIVQCVVMMDKGYVDADFCRGVMFGKAKNHENEICETHNVSRGSE